MRVALLIRADAFSLIGGPTEQVRRYADHLRARDVDVTVHASDGPPRGRFDVAHLFNLDWPLETARQFETARRCADRVVLSTIHHRSAWMEDLHLAARAGAAAALAGVVSLERFEALRGLWLARSSRPQWPEAVLQLLRGPRARQRGVLRRVDRWLTLAEGERRSLEEDFGLRGVSSHVPNGVSLDEGDPPPGLPDEFLLCVGRIEARKNQLALLDAAERIDLPVVLAGPPNPRHVALSREVERRAAESGRVTWLRDPPREQLLALYRRAACHVLPSWCEVVPLVDLEAATAGARVVTTSRGYTSEYLGERAMLWQPGTGSEALADCVAAALGAPRPEPLSPDDMSWERACEALLEAYRETLETPRSCA